MISRKSFLKGGLSTLAASFFGGWPLLMPLRSYAKGRAAEAEAGPIAAKRLNILLIMTDQERSWAELPADLALPRRRAFAETALTFSRYYGNAVACGPSRSVIYTGQHIQKTGVYDNPGDAPGRNDLNPEKTPTIGMMLQNEGYRTGYIGKWHLSVLDKGAHTDLPDALKGFGFDEYDPALESGDTDGEWQGGFRADPSIAANAAKWLKGRARKKESQPWFLAVNLINPHDVRYFDATGHQRDGLFPHFASEIGPVPDTPLYARDLGYPLPITFPGPNPRPVAAHRLYVEDEEYFFGPMPLSDKAAWARYQNYYFNCLADVDRHIGTVLDSLKASGMAEDTMVIFTADHGEMAGAQGLKGKGPFLYKENFHLPLVIRHPALAAGATASALASSVDLAPTILAAAGVDEAARKARYPALKGHDLLTAGLENLKGVRDGILLMSDIVHCCNPDKKKHIIDTLYARARGEKTAPFTFPADFVDFNNRSFLRGIYDGRYKFGRYFSPNAHNTPRDWKSLTAHNDLELYDTEKDPQEVHNLAADPAYKDIILALNSHLNRLMQTEAGPDRGAFFPGGAKVWALPGA